MKIYIGQSTAVTDNADPMHKKVTAYMHLLIVATSASVKQASYQAEIKYGISDLECESMYRDTYGD